jgi:hypothetical protein
VFEKDIFFAASVVPALAQIDGHFIDFPLLHAVSPRLSGYRSGYSAWLWVADEVNGRV